MSCEHDCDRPPVFPADILNRPGLSTFRYRIGTYAKMRAHMLDRLVKSPPLAGWTHLGSDEPGVALLEGAALVGDILTFYQQLYANETKLRTARWDESLRDLVRLTGYRPAPGLGGASVFALEIEGDGPVVVPAGFPIAAQLEGEAKPSLFEITAAVEAWPAFSAFHLYRRRLGLQPIAKGTSSLDIHRREGATDLATRTLAADEIAKGDTVLILSGPFDPHEILVVDYVETQLDRVTLHFAGAVQESHPAEVTAFVIGRTFRHHGAEAAPEFTTFRENPPKVTVHASSYLRPTDSATTGTAHYGAFGAREIPLDREMDDLATGASVVCVGQSGARSGGGFALVRRVERITPREALWANATAQVSVLTLDRTLSTTALARIPAAKIPLGVLIAEPVAATQIAAAQQTAPRFAQISLDSEMLEKALTGGAAAQIYQLAPAMGPLFESFQLLEFGAGTHDIRRLRVYETIGPKMILRAPPRSVAGVSDGRVLYFGTRAEAEALAGRRLLLSGMTETPQEIAVATHQPELASAPEGTAGDRAMWPIQLSTAPEAGPAGFDEANPAVTVYGNLADATQGETQKETAIGSGDMRLAFQTFALPKPLTFLPDSARTPPYAGELEIRVAGRLWRPVESFFDQPADAEIYVIRQDDDGNDVVQFGDGVNGARLASGRANVTALWRTGAGARGELAEDAEPKPKGKLKPLKSIWMPGPATGGADPETMANARAAAPGRMQSLGRLVALADYEAEARTVPGVVKAGATFGAGDAPAIDLTVLTEDGSVEAGAAVAAALRRADRCRGPSRHVLNVWPGRRRWVALSLRLGTDPALKPEDVAAGVAAALGARPALTGEAAEGGLFALGRRFGQDVHLSQVVAAAQRTTGVVWVEPVAFALLLPTSDDPAELTLSANPPLLMRLGVSPREVLALSARHLTLDALAAVADEECPT